MNNCPPYVHELNDTAERYNITIKNIARCLLEEAKVDKRYWPEIVGAARYLKNRTLTNILVAKRLYEIFFNRRPDVSHLHLYGSRVFVRRSEQKTSSKWDKKADIGVLLGYDDVGFRVLINGKILVARHVEIIENYVKCIGLDCKNNEKSEECTSDKDSVFESADEKDEKLDKKSNILMSLIKIVYLRGVMAENFELFRFKDKS